MFESSGSEEGEGGEGGAGGNGERERSRITRSFELTMIALREKSVHGGCVKRCSRVRRKWRERGGDALSFRTEFELFDRRGTADVFCP